MDNTVFSPLEGSKVGQGTGLVAPNVLAKGAVGHPGHTRATSETVLCGTYLCPGGFIHNTSGTQFHGFFNWGGEKDWEIITHPV